MDIQIFLKVLFCVFIFSSCSFKKSSESREPDKIVVIERVQSGDLISRAEVQLSFIPNPLEFGSYVLRVTWPQGRRIFVGVKLEEGEGAQQGESRVEDRLDGEVLNYYDLACKSGDSFKIKMSFASKVGGQFGNYEYPMDCPIDFEINKTISSLSILPTKLTGRLFLRNGARIKLGTQKLRLDNLIGLHIDGTATIEALNIFNADEEEQIIINAKQASGKLLLDLKGANGRDGESGEERALLFEHQQLLKQNQPKPGTSGQAGDVELICRRPGKEGQDCSDKCTRQPTNGTAGQDGLIAGLAGRDGRNGSDTSKIKINVLEQDVQNPFEVTVLLMPGLPGKGGIGGKGQPGAPGGIGGHNPGGRCQNAQAGPVGQPAASGPNGKPGRPGGCGVIEVNPELLNVINLAEQSELGADCIRNRSQILKATEAK